MVKLKKIFAVILALSVIFAYGISAYACTDEEESTCEEVTECEAAAEETEEVPVLTMALAVSTESVEDESLEELLSNQVYLESLGRPSSVTTRLSEYDSIRVSWSSVSGADGYYVYYKKSTAASWSKKTVSGTVKTLSSLADGVKYNIKVQAYKESGNTVYVGSMRAGSSRYTLKRVAQPDVEDYSAEKVTVSWTKINGCDGYQISRSTSLTGTNIVSTVSSSSSSANISTPTSSKYYYKVRAYVEVNGSKVCAPWSYVKAYRN